MSIAVIAGGHCPHDDFHEEANTPSVDFLRRMKSEEK
jgi:hypothetical protein